MDAQGVKRFEQVVLPHLDAAYSLARYLVRDEHDAEDLVQDAYLRALRYFESYRGGDERAWLLTIVRRTCYSWLKRHRAGPAPAPFDETEHAAEAGGDPETHAVHDNLRDLLSRAVDALPIEFREVVVLRDVQDLSYKEIAGVLGIPLGTVMSRLARARRRLQSALPVEDFGRA
jgi:RNA polymerase sigma-70 factor (ECF subfamily)